MVKRKIKNSKKKRPSPKKKGKKFYEFFDIGKKGKEKTVKVEGFENIEKKPNRKQIKEENKILRNILILIGIIAVLFLSGYLIINNIRTFEYQGVNFETVNFCDKKPCLILYQTSLPVNYNGKKADYNFYLRKDPRKLNVSFDGKLNLIQKMVIDSTESFNCNGDGIIAMANLVKLYGVIGGKVIKNDTLKCDPSGNYMFLQVRKGNKTSIEQFGTACYNLNVNNCEILEVTERFMIETFSKVNKLI